MNRRSHLLIVDDDEVDRQLYLRLLTQHAPGLCEIEHATNGAAGAAMLHAQQYDCVLLDFDLPDMTGLDFLVQAADSDGTLPCAVVLITGRGNELIAVEAMKHGADDYLPKEQVSASSLWRTVTTAATKFQLRRRLALSLRELSAANAALGQEVATRMATETELRAAKEAAEEANRAKTRFVAMVTHELRTPLNGILGYTELLRIEGGLSERQDARVGAMLQAGQHLHDMIGRVLDFASIETTGIELQPEPVSVHDLTERCIALIEPIAAEQALTVVTMRAAAAPRQIVADPARLRQVLLNLLGNAVKYTRHGGIELRVLAGAAENALRIEVADTGPGIDGADRAHLFRDFERLSAAAGTEGAGLGLAIAARIIALMNGTLGYSPNPGGGSVFWLDLPPAAASILRSAPAPAAPLAPGRTLLVVDDIAMNRDVIEGFLRAAGHFVALAETGEDAIRLAGEQVFDAILMDVRMPGIDGLQATRAIRKLAGGSARVPILALTAYSFPEQVAQCLAAGMDGHVAKPVGYATLLQAVADVVYRVKAGVAPDAASPTATGDEANAASDPGVRFDRETFNQILRFLPGEEAAGALPRLRAQQQRLLRLLDQAAPPHLLGGSAHEVASVAGMFGFAALSTAARDFEHEVARNPPRTDRLAGRLRAEIQAAMTELDALAPESKVNAA